MAKSSDKRRIDENAAHLRKLGGAILIANAAYVVGRLLLKRGSATWLHWGGFAFTTVVYAFCWFSIRAALAPAYSATGELVYAGQDLKTGGVLSYFHDVVYVSIFVQLGGALSDWFWLAWLAVPVYALYALLVHVALPYWNTPRLPDLPETEAERRRREKRERQERRSQKFARR
eukprot:scaffold9.g3081.t1